MDDPASQNCVGDAAGIVESHKRSCCCLTRSEVYALVREVINKRKHCDDVDSVCDHVNSVGFTTIQMKYIRENLKRAFIIVGDDCTQRKRLDLHARRLENIFNLNTVLEDEYRYCTSVRNGRTNSKHVGHNDEIRE
ncbi:lef11 [Artaxa digramma nucleopolyhedrovirus]|uniref:Late expression factor 11 n=1 Tax=Artaxa digramma nucleopolyhedrovirus TaxID=3070910 RepID=A0AAE6R740_9ABAC|nr:lef11 [Euproctis digramma nucleopolyhedrovirus]QHB21706.1 lef11 [Artaxa digramma nucleopolyhedrovirus]